MSYETRAVCNRCGDKHLLIGGAAARQDTPAGWMKLVNGELLCKTCAFIYRELEKKFRDMEHDFWNKKVEENTKDED